MSTGGTQTSNTVSEFKPPDYTVEPWKGYVGNASALNAQGLPIYTGQTVANQSQESQLGSGMLTSLATQGSPLYDSAQTNLTGTLQGAFSDPYATAANPYIGQNPYLDQLIQGTNRRMTDAYSTGTAAQTDAAAARAGAYGGSGYEEATQRNQRALADAIGQTDAGISGQNYYNSANLAEQGLNRASGAVQQERGRQIQAAGMAPGYQSSDISAIQAMMGGGDAKQNYQQQLLNAGQQLFGQYAQAPWQLSDLLGSALSRASGQGSQSSQQIYGPGMGGLQGLLGLGAAGYGLLPGGG